MDRKEYNKQYYQKTKERDREYRERMSKRYDEEHPEQKRARSSKWSKNNRDAINKRRKEWRHENPLIASAHNKMQRAASTGKIKSPERCSGCGEPKLRLHGHHEDYGKPLDVVWYCNSCHRKIHSKKEKVKCT